jgi:selenocysteine lyase/cysteine desulfurase
MRPDGAESASWAGTRRLFPVTRELAYLNHAGVAPISTRVREALDRYAEEALSRGAFRYAAFVDAEIERARGRAAALVGAHPDEIAFVKNTTEGLGIVAAGLAWRPGDRVVTCDLEYPSNVYPWWWLRGRGVETLMLRGEGGRLPLERVADALRDPAVRLLALSSVEFGSGFRQDLPALGRLCRERGVLLCVDAIQSLGAIPLDVESCGIDFLAADGHKWLLSVEGCGIFYCARRALERLTPRVVGWRSVVDNADYDRLHLELQPGAGGAALLSPRGPGETSGIVSFVWPGEEPQRTAERLRRAGVFVVARRGGVRASPHFYNDEAELDRLLAAL